MPLAALQTPGFHYEADPQTGERASKPFQDIDTEAGLKFYEENFVNNLLPRKPLWDEYVLPKYHCKRVPLISNLSNKQTTLLP
jgi:hypothetical protein